MGICEVCGKNKSDGVACVPCVPISVSYCMECLVANAHPLWVLIANTAQCDGLGNTNEYWKSMVYDTCKHLNISLNVFTGEVGQYIIDMYTEQLIKEEKENDANS